MGEIEPTNVVAMESPRAKYEAPSQASMEMGHYEEDSLDSNAPLRKLIPKENSSLNILIRIEIIIITLALWTAYLRIPH